LPWQKLPRRLDDSRDLAEIPSARTIRGGMSITRDELREELAAYSTKADLSALREETAQGFADMRRYMEILIEDFKTWMKTQFDGTNARIDDTNARLAGTNARVDVMNRTLTGKLVNHDGRIDALDGRVTRLESRTRRRT
jgi:hypothetical protein